MEMSEFESLYEAINERTLSESRGISWRRMPKTDLVATLEELQDRGMLKEAEDD